MAKPMKTHSPFSFYLRVNTFTGCAPLLFIYILLHLVTNDSNLASPLFAAEICCSFIVFVKSASEIVLAKNDFKFPKAITLLQTFGIIALSTLFFHLVAVLYGAPFFTAVAETYHLSLMLTSTTVIPSLVVHGVSLENWVRVYLQSSCDSEAEVVVKITTLCSVIGAWLGAFPIPLDWDRSWQAWPITCLVGNVLGYVTGLLIGTVKVYLQQRHSRKFKSI